jgi:hypothetical protein
LVSGNLTAGLCRNVMSCNTVCACCCMRCTMYCWQERCQRQLCWVSAVVELSESVYQVQVVSSAYQVYQQCIKCVSSAGCKHSTCAPSAFVWQERCKQQHLVRMGIQQWGLGMFKPCMRCITRCWQERSQQQHYLVSVTC